VSCTGTGSLQRLWRCGVLVSELHLRRVRSVWAAVLGSSDGSVCGSLGCVSNAGRGELPPSCAGLLGEQGARAGACLVAGYLVDPASSHMLVSKIKPCMSKYKRLVL
jgi:hypothetical protein